MKPRLQWKSIVPALAVLICSGLAFGQTLDERLKAGANLSPDLGFPVEAQELSFFSPLGMAIYKPAGAGPFPAVVIHHSCGGIRTEVKDWAKAALAQGYVAFVLDSLGPRGLKTNCLPPSPVTVSRGVKDAFQALAHLKSLPFVDASRIGFIGFSWGAMVGLLTASKEISNALSSGDRFAAAVVLYPMCNFPGSAGFPTSFEYLRPDIDKPLLVLMGGEDTETPASECLPRLDALRARGAPVESKLYASATHCWDCASIDSLRKTDFQGHSVVYRYDKEITDDSVRRTFEFLARNLAPRAQ